MRPFYALFVDGELKKVSLVYRDIVQCKGLHERMTKNPKIDIRQYTISEHHPLRLEQPLTLES